MEVTPELKKDIHNAIVVALNAYAQDEKVDEHLTDAVVEVVKEIPEPEAPQAPVDMVPVKYVGRRKEYSDGLFDTGIWQQGETRLVPKSVAGQMFVHPDVYTMGDMADAAGSEPVSDEDKDEGDYSEELQQARDAVQQMTRKAQVETFVKENFGNMEVDLPPTARLDDFKQFAIRQIDIQRMP